MATLNIDLMPWLARRSEAAEAARKKTDQEGTLRRALALQAFGGAAGTQELDPLQPVPGLAGVTDSMSPRAGLAQELANDRLEQQRKAALPDVLALAQGAALQQAGLDPQKLAQARLETLRGNLLADSAPTLAPAARVNAANKLDVSPVRSDGGVFYDRFNPQVPFIGMSEPAAALADARWAASRARDAQANASGAQARLSGVQADVAGLRLNALQNVLENPELSPLVGADVAIARTVSTPQRVKVKAPEGDTYYDATRRPNGSFDYALVTDPAGKPLQVPASESDPRTALQKDTAFIADTLQLAPEQAILWKLQARPKSDQQLSDEIALRLLSTDTRAARDAQNNPEQFRARVTQVFKSVRPGVTVPAPSSGVPVSAPAPGPAQPTPATGALPPRSAAPVPAPPKPAAGTAATMGYGNPPDAQARVSTPELYAQARAAVAAGADALQVRERLRALGLDPNRL